MLSEYQRLKDAIKDAFETFPPPVITKGLELSDDQYEDTIAFRGKKWTELTVEDFHNQMYILGSVPDRCFPYYLGAHMHASMVEGIFFSDAFGMIFDNPLLSSQRKRKPSFASMIIVPYLSGKQLDVFDEFLKYSAPKLPEYHRSIVEYTRKKISEAR